ncbi:MAG TPA: hypothetical protein VJ276_17865 [Thermoanaerobaculia bacterium]|nr:hypothetical protein [Thermoanaerobaculia bacterium]
MITADGFVNRLPELAEFKAALAVDDPENRVVVLSAISGIGKSSFTAKLQREKPEKAHVRVDMPSAQHPEGAFLHALARAIDGAAATCQPLVPLGTYLRDVPTPDMRSRYHDMLLATFGEGVLGWLNATFVKPIKVIGDRLANRGQFDPNSIWGATTSEITLMLGDYVRWVMNGVSLCICIENAQVIDQTSLDLLLKILAHDNGHFVILEFTTNDTRGRREHELIRALQSHVARVSQRELRMLPVKDALTLLQHEDVEAVVEKVYISHHGNLRQLKDFDVVVDVDPVFGRRSAVSQPEWNATAHRLLTLREPAQFTLACIVTHGGAVSPELLSGLYATADVTQRLFVSFDTATTQLAAEEFIREDRDGRLVVAHDSISPIVMTSETYLRFRLLAYAAWEEFYRHLHRERNYSVLSRSEVLSRFFEFMLHTDPASTLGLIPEIRRFALEQLYPRQALRVLETLRDTLTRLGSASARVIDTVAFALLDIYYAFGLYERAFALLDTIRARGPRWSAYRAALLDRTDAHADAVAFVRDALATPDDDAAHELTMKLILVLSLRSLNRFDEAVKLFEALLQDRRYIGLREYGYVLRNTQIFYGFAATLPYLRRSIDLFDQLGLPEDAAHSRISISMQLTRLGRLDEALRELEAAEAALVGRSLERHITLNNRGIIRLYTGNPSDSASELFVRALETATSSFDRIAVLNNLLAAKSIGNDLGYAEAVAGELVTFLPTQPDEVLHCITYFNIASHYERTGNAAAHQRYLEKARGCSNDMPSLWNHRLYGEPVLDPDAEFVAAFPFDLVLLSYWHFPISDFHTRTEPV